MAFLLAMGLLPSQFDNDGDVPQPITGFGHTGVVQISAKRRPRSRHLPIQIGLIWTATILAYGAIAEAVSLRAGHSRPVQKSLGHGPSRNWNYRADKMSRPDRHVCWLRCG